MRDAVEKGCKSFTIEYNDAALTGLEEKKSSPADEGIAASKADALRAKLAEGAGELADISIALRKAWDKAGYSEDDAIREDQLVLAAQILGGLNVVDGKSGPDATFMRSVANLAKELAENLDTIATDYEVEA